MSKVFSVLATRVSVFMTCSCYYFLVACFALAIWLQTPPVATIASHAHPFYSQEELQGFTQSEPKGKIKTHELWDGEQSKTLSVYLWCNWHYMYTYKSLLIIYIKETRWKNLDLHPNSSLLGTMPWFSELYQRTALHEACVWSNQHQLGPTDISSLLPSRTGI